MLGRTFSGLLWGHDEGQPPSQPWTKVDHPPAPTQLSHVTPFTSSVSASLHHSVAWEASATPETQAAPTPVQSECLSGGAC